MRVAAFAACSLLSLTACRQQVAPGAAGDRIVLADASDAQAVFGLPADVDVTRVYVGEANLLELDSDQPQHFGVIDLAPGAEVGVVLSTTDGYDDWIGFKVHKLAASGSLVELGTLEGAGVAGALLRTAAGGTFVFESVSSWMPTTLQLDISCDGEACAVLGQPGDSCGSRGLGECDEGLFCQIDEGCGRDDRGGVCAVPAEFCPAYVAPDVCGCDGKTYQGACKANAAGVNVDFLGACACDPTVFNVKVDGEVDVAGTWIGQADTSGFRISSTLQLFENGDFVYEQTHEPKCWDTGCRMAALFQQLEGSWENQGFAVQLYPAPGSLVPDGLAQSFGVLTNCEGAVQLHTTELGQDRVLERDACADLSCDEGQHCELEQVWCITAPCPALPTCVDD